MPLVVGTWASVADVQELFGVTVTDQQVTLAQVLIEGHIRRVYRPTDSATGDYYWLTRAVAAQAVHLKANPDLLTRVKFTSTSQDGWSISYPEDEARQWLAQPAMLFLNNLRGAANTTVRFNSAFQSNGRRRPRWKQL